MDVEVEYIYPEEEYIVKKKIDGQTYCMVFELPFEEDSIGRDTIHVNVCLYIISKRKDIHKVLWGEPVITGKSPFKSVAFVRSAFNALEKHVVNEELKYHKKIIIYCTWLDSRRRDAYYKFLSKRGYTYRVYNGVKCIAKEFTSELP